jgi:large subunit ribosomal protein L21
MKYAIINIGGKQHSVSEGDVLDIDRIESKDKVIFEDVLLFVDGDKAEIGKPTVKDVSVSGKVMSQFRGKKLVVSKFKSKVRVRRKMGFRASLSKVLIEKINTTKKSEAKAKTEPKTSVKKK